MFLRKSTFFVPTACLSCNFCDESWVTFWSTLHLRRHSLSILRILLRVQRHFLEHPTLETSYHANSVIPTRLDGWLLKPTFPRLSLCVGGVVCPRFHLDTLCGPRYQYIPTRLDGWLPILYTFSKKVRKIIEILQKPSFLKKSHRG